ncbi:hypothetical protein P7C73_g4423, partial [Tremellales sp. Uapishka_1]
MRNTSGPESELRALSFRSRPSKNQAPPGPNPSNQFCLSCGRIMRKLPPLLLPSRSNFSASETKPSPTPRKYCSASCRSRAHNPSLKPVHLLLAQTYHSLLSSTPTGEIIPCSQVEKLVFSDPTPPDAREEARRAARRLVNFGFTSQGVEEDRQVEGVQAGKVVEGSHAKGEWGIRWVR